MSGNYENECPQIVTMAKELDEIIYAALTADTELMSLVEGRIFSTCIEIPPGQEDNTPTPYIIITDDPYQNDMSTKDDVWEGNVDHVSASVTIAADNPSAVKTLRHIIRRAIGGYVASMDNAPFLTASHNEGIAWDFMKPCYYDTLHYQCDMEVNYNHE
jgi:hypothetical protein